MSSSKLWCLVNLLYLQASHALVSLTCYECYILQMVIGGVPCKRAIGKPNACRHISCGGDDFRKFVVRYSWQKAWMLMCDVGAGQAAGLYKPL